jgi:hypothetical protein
MVLDFNVQARVANSKVLQRYRLLGSTGRSVGDGLGTTRCADLLALIARCGLAVSSSDQLGPGPLWCISAGDTFPQDTLPQKRLGYPSF